MPPPTVTIRRAKGQPAVDPGTDFRMCVIGSSSLTVVAAGAISPLYYQPGAMASDFGIGDGVDACTQALVATDDNPQPPGLAIFTTLAASGLTPGVRGTLTTSGVTGTSVVTRTSAAHPFGTFEPRVRVVDDGNNGAGRAVGSAGIILQGSPDNGRTWLPTSALGTATTWKLQIPNPGGSPFDTGVQYDFTASTDTLITGDNWSESKTKAPQWAIADLYTAGSPGTGALMTIAKSATNFGCIAISEPVAAGDIATLSAALDAMKALKASCRPTLIVRFRDQAVGESDATYIAATTTFLTACARDARIVGVAGDGWLTDAFRGYVYSRNGLAEVLARRAGSSIIAGVKGEKVAQSPAWAARGPLLNFSVRDSAGNPVGHDEKVRGGVLGPGAGKGGFLTFYYEGHEAVAGTYIAGAPCLYDIDPTVETWMDNAVSSGIERLLYAVAFTFLQGAAIVVGGVLDDDARDAMSAAACRAIKDNYQNEIANPNDPNLVTVDPNVTVNGPDITVTWYVNDDLFDYINGIVMTIANARP